MATLEELRSQYLANLLGEGQKLIRDLPPLPKETVEGISGAEQQALDLARTGVANRPDFMSMGVGSLGQATLSAANAATQAQAQAKADQTSAITGMFGGLAQAGIGMIKN